MCSARPAISFDYTAARRVPAVFRRAPSAVFWWRAVGQPVLPAVSGRLGENAETAGKTGCPTRHPKKYGKPQLLKSSAQRVGIHRSLWSRLAVGGLHFNEPRPEGAVDRRALGEHMPSCENEGCRTIGTRFYSTSTEFWPTPSRSTFRAGGKSWNHMGFNLIGTFMSSNALESPTG
jgi:hypothetical protein